MSKAEFHTFTPAMFQYSVTPKQASVVGLFPEIVYKRICTRCGGPFETRSRTKHRCDPCQKVVGARLQKLYLLRHKEKRRKEKNA